MDAIDTDPLRVESMWQDYKQQPASWVNSFLVHLAVMAALIGPFIFGPRPSPVSASRPFVRLYFPFEGRHSKSGGDSGGGAREAQPASVGKIPEFSETPLAPPMARIPILNPQIAVQPNLPGPPDLKLPEMSANGPWGDPHGVLGDASNGRGCCGGIGDGNGSNVGPGNGTHYGAGGRDGYGDEVVSVSEDVTPPIPTYQPEPSYTEEARKAKLSGVVTLAIVVDAQGNPRDIRVLKPLGLGLDEKALETVRIWRFKPATRHGVPVAVRMWVEITFRLF